MNWRRLAWLVILLLIVAIVWAAIDLKEMYEKIASARLKDTDNVDQRLASLREKRATFAARPDYVAEVIADGACRAQTIARLTLDEVKEKMGLIRRTAGK